MCNEKEAGMNVIQHALSKNCGISSLQLVYFSIGQLWEIISPPGWEICLCFHVAIFTTMGEEKNDVILQFVIIVPAIHLKNLNNQWASKEPGN